MGTRAWPNENDKPATLNFGLQRCLMREILKPSTSAWRIFLSTEEFDQLSKEAFEESSRGSGRSDRHISPEVLLSTIEKVHEGLPRGTLTELIPTPEQEFVEKALQQV